MISFIHHQNGSIIKRKRRKREEKEAKLTNLTK